MYPPPELKGGRFELGEFDFQWVSVFVTNQLNKITEFQLVAPILLKQIKLTHALSGGQQPHTISGFYFWYKYACKTYPRVTGRHNQSEPNPPHCWDSQPDAAWSLNAGVAFCLLLPAMFCLYILHLSADNAREGHHNQCASVCFCTQTCGMHQKHSQIMGSYTRSVSPLLHVFYCTVAQGVNALIEEVVQIKTTASHTLWVALDQTEQAWARRTPCNDASMCGTKGLWCEGGWPPGLDRTQWRVEKKINREEEAAWLHQSRRLSRMIFVQTLQKLMAQSR